MAFLKKNGQDFFQLWAESAKYKFREGNFCDSWTNGKLDYKQNIQLKNVKLKVILDEDCEYKIAVSVGNDQWITLPKSSLFGENLNLGKYYNQELSLSKGKEFARYEGEIYYVPKVMCGQIKICELVPYSFPICNSDQARFWGSSTFYAVAYNKIVVEKNNEGDLSIYFADAGGTRSANINSGGENFVNYANSTLKAVLLENSNIREVLPELGIDVITPLERKVKCLVNKMYSEVTERVAHLEAKNYEETLVTKVAGNQGLQNAVADNLKGDQGFKNL